MLFNISKAIVFEEELKYRLGKFGNKNKIIVIPHAVETFEYSISKEKARAELGIEKNKFVILLFGFITYYKGTDWLIDAYSKLTGQKPHRFSLIIAGGQNSNHIDKPAYQEYIKKIYKQCDQRGIILTGFVPEEKIPIYFQASDIVIFPYRVFMSSSGPLSMAFSFKKPFLVSKHLKKVFRTKDIKEILNKSSLVENDLVFYSTTGFIDLIKKFKKNTKYLHEIAGFSESIAKKRNWKTVGLEFYNKLVYRLD